MTVIDIVYLFVCWTLFFAIANFRIKCVIETKNIPVLFWKHLLSFLHFSHIWCWGFFTFLVALAHSVPLPNQGNYKYFDLCFLTLLSTNWTYNNDWMYFLSKNNCSCQFICLLSLLSLKFIAFEKMANFFFHLCISLVLFDSFFSSKVTPFLKLSFVVNVGWKLLMLDAI